MTKAARTKSTPGEVTMTALALMDAADTLTGVTPSMTTLEISRLQNVTRDELEQRHEDLQQAREGHAQEEGTDHVERERNGNARNPGRVHPDRDLGEGVRGLQADGVAVEGIRAPDDP